MDTVMPVMNIFLAEALSLSWSTFILVRNKEIKFIIPHASSIQYPIFNSLHDKNRYKTAPAQGTTLNRYTRPSSLTHH